ncbi:MAG: polyphosphate polymerase domain-containing protein [Halioglobus sp.]
MTFVVEPDIYAQAHAQLRAQPHALEMETQQAVKRFKGHSLEQQEEVNLANRTDSKYLMPAEALVPLLEALGPEYSVLQCDDARIFSYENTYFDTSEFDLYHDHHNGKLSRHKWRHRRYKETDTAYLEYKAKTNQERTVKTRHHWPAQDNEATLPPTDGLQTSLYVNYRRITCWNHDSNERLTIDYDLRWQKPGADSGATMDNHIIVELKREGKVYGSQFVRRAKDFGFLPCSFSKYCIGMCVTDDGQLKKNRFKPLLQQVQWSKI